MVSVPVNQGKPAVTQYRHCDWLSLYLFHSPLGFVPTYVSSGLQRLKAIKVSFLRSVTSPKPHNGLALETFGFPEGCLLHGGDFCGAGDGLQDLPCSK